MTLPDQTTRPPWWERIGYEATPLEMAQWLARTSDANRDAWFTNQRRNNAEAHLCVMHDHASQIEHLQGQLTKARERIAWLEREYRAT